MVVFNWLRHGMKVQVPQRRPSPMGEAPSNPSIPDGYAIAGGGFAVPPQTRVPAVLKLRPVQKGVSVGLPIIDVPPMVEPVGFDEPIAEIRLPDPSRRQVRRRFLPPPPPPRP